MSKLVAIVMTMSKLLRATLAAAALAVAIPTPLMFSPTALATPVSQYTTAVVDHTGVLSEATEEEATQRLQEFRQEEKRALFIVIVSDFGEQSPKDWASEAVAMNGGGNTGVLAIASGTRKMWVAGGNQWTDSELEAIYNAAYEKLAASDYNGAVGAAIDAATGTMSTSSKVWLAGGAGALALAGAGAYGASKKRKKKVLESSRSIAPGNTQELSSLPTQTLRDRAEEELVATDESIRRAEEELRVARSEFGSSRTQTLAQALAKSRATLEHAFELHQKIYDAIPESEEERRGMLVEIISSTGQANAQLDDQSQTFADLRTQLINAPERVDTLTQQLVEIRSRIPYAESTLQHLVSSGYPVNSLTDNVDVANASAQEVEKALEQARELLSKGAGQQGGLVDIMELATRGISSADAQLSAIEHAEENLALAQTRIPQLRTQILQQLEEAKTLQLSSPVVEDARGVLQRNETESDIHEGEWDNAATDPLDTLNSLTQISEKLEQELTTRRIAAADKARQDAIVNQQLQQAAGKIQTAEDLIRSRGSVIGPDARSLLLDAQNLYQQAVQERSIPLAQQAARRADAAIDAANSDYRRYRNQNRGDSSGAFIAGMVLNSLLNSGNGFGGGFGGGGSFGGGGFGGGGGFSGGGGNSGGFGGSF